MLRHVTLRSVDSHVLDPWTHMSFSPGHLRPGGEYGSWAGPTV